MHPIPLCHHHHRAGKDMSLGSKRLWCSATSYTTGAAGRGQKLRGGVSARREGLIWSIPRCTVGVVSPRSDRWRVSLAWSRWRWVSLPSTERRWVRAHHSRGITRERVNPCSGRCRVRRGRKTSAQATWVCSWGRVLHRVDERTIWRLQHTQKRGSMQESRLFCYPIREIKYVDERIPHHNRQ